MSCRVKGSSVSRSRKFLALMFSCSTACSQEEASGYGACPQASTGATPCPEDGTIPARGRQNYHVATTGSQQRPCH